MAKSVALLPLLALTVSAATAQTPVRPIVLQTMPRTVPRTVPGSVPRPVLVGGSFVPRPGKLNAAAVRGALVRNNAAVKQRPKLLVALTMTVPGIARVNGAPSGAFEPGGAYQITGHGFGTNQANVFLSFGGRIIKLDVVNWSDDQVVAAMPDTLSGVSDAASVTLNVGRPGQHPFTTSKFGFRAARADQTLAISKAMVSAGGPFATRTDGEFFVVSRFTTDSGDTKRCFEPGSDTIRWNPQLKPGFDVTGYYWFHASDAAGKSGSTTSTPRGSYSIAFESDALRINYGVMRDYTPPFGLLPRHGGCSSDYRVKLIVTGPRGVSPL